MVITVGMLERLTHAVWYGAKWHTSSAKIKHAMREQTRYAAYKRERAAYERERRAL